ncbi:28S ribosomal protein S21, mitochondrial [Belonocnema kinseyi]|uniref:28S ribosomal protein S21, mitochondrial n=1 Tax=Belonocnema kinseyi TaxID=2817044 RepID=UPI00143D0167|nr:28S ribosomal protein S21, mitochondrial [Belonocnema kinseyi]XP_033222457.1 28S ribosomal protein S21, mitochondrial [Belonocnema kinseyi]XP_033222458.1 28S ribosomal protein S21, mitochondrial [Belonocnema kinseyi]XP_033222459.1 28S ribosomal protein S21, mitochondrial [Belonocnema kinseyi]
MGWRHPFFIARTVLVRNNDVEGACRILNRIMGREEIFDQFRRTRYYEKPTQTRRRVNYQICKALYDEDMSRKIQLVLRTNRLSPFPGAV